MKKKIYNYCQEKFSLDNQDDPSIVAAQEAVETKSEVPEVKTNIVSKVAYRTFYAISYGVVFSSLLTAKLLIPKHSVIDNALHDGAAAAKAALEEKERQVKEVAEQTGEFLSENLGLPDPA